MRRWLLFLCFNIRLQSIRHLRREGGREHAETKTSLKGRRGVEVFSPSCFQKKHKLICLFAVGFRKRREDGGY